MGRLARLRNLILEAKRSELIIFNQDFNRKILGLGRLARFTNLDLEARSPRLSLFSKGFIKKMIGSGRLARWGNLDLKMPYTEIKENLSKTNIS